MSDFCKVAAMLTNLTQCSENRAYIQCLKRNIDNGVVDLKNGKGLALEHLIKLCRKEKDSHWNGVLLKYPGFCGKRTPIGTKMEVMVSLQETSNSRRVLAPLALKQNEDNIVAAAGALGTSRKRKWNDVDAENHGIVNKRGKTTISELATTACSVVVQNDSWQDLLLRSKCVGNNSYVKLYDVLKEIPFDVQIEDKVVDKRDFMDVLGLISDQAMGNKKFPDCKINPPLSLVNNPSIPFSSDYGRRLLVNKGRNYLPEDIALRKLERTEWYLRSDSRFNKSMNNNNKGTNAATAIYNKSNASNRDTAVSKNVYVHTYKFPKRQFSQVHRNLPTGFGQYLCKPVCVKLEKSEVQVLKHLHSNETIVQQKTVGLGPSKDTNDSLLMPNKCSISNGHTFGLANPKSSRGNRLTEE